ncbi:hypothetical protein FA95DRAFT_69775 [Auriscalpium vulgare]|uniref:Uncharacterized protein n=1 Tax=Auriscalpium vulgare TaxID=40419 RepID=A0ACB8S8L6_9AGAM|nr:hypothetical protein FA95DRAFT_69775 [Auriscalpium vulgare]
MPPRQRTPAPTRTRVTNKTRLRVIRGDLPTESHGTNEASEQLRVVSTAGVDEEDVNEHHLQAVLAAAATQPIDPHQNTNICAENSADKLSIPTPGSTSIVIEYDEWYAGIQWEDPFTLIKQSMSVEVAIDYSLSDGYTYYMDELDRAWLLVYNEGAREGVDKASAAAKPGGSAHPSSEKDKGRAREIYITKDDFELVMGWFEKAADEKTGSLHQVSTVPSFSDLQKAFEAPLPSHAFSAFVEPSWLPSPETLLQFAHSIYAHWRGRRLARNNQRIIPTLNLNVTDTANEAYVCFRRRPEENKRRTRASIAPTIEDLRRIRKDLDNSVALVGDIHAREKIKQLSHRHDRAIWQRRCAFAVEKAKFPLLGKEDDEILYGPAVAEISAAAAESSTSGQKRARPAADSSQSGLPPKAKKQKRAQADALTNATPALNAPRKATKRKRASKPPAATESAATPLKQKKKKKCNALHPRHQLQARLQHGVSEIYDNDEDWHDVIDDPYERPLCDTPSQYFKYLPYCLEPDDCAEIVPQHARAVRSRIGRGGVIRVDRRGFTSPPSITALETSPLQVSRRGNEEDAEDQSRSLERWKFDNDDEPDAPDGTDRVLVDEFDPKYLVARMRLLPDDERRLKTDHTAHLPAADRSKAISLPDEDVRSENERLTEVNRLTQEGLEDLHPEFGGCGLLGSCPDSDSASGESRPASPMGGVEWQWGAEAATRHPFPLAQVREDPNFSSLMDLVDLRRWDVPSSHPASASRTPDRPRTPPRTIRTFVQGHLRRTPPNDTTRPAHSRSPRVNRSTGQSGAHTRTPPLSLGSPVRGSQVPSIHY